MITRADVADLREGDVVELGFSSGSVIRGPLIEDRHIGGLEIAEAGWSVRTRDGDLGHGLKRYAETLTVISRAKPPLYVNSDKTEPDPGDVVRDTDSDSPQVWHCCDRSDIPWVTTEASDHEWYDLDSLPDRLRLLVDGRTGQVVP